MSISPRNMRKPRATISYFFSMQIAAGDLFARSAPGPGSLFPGRSLTILRDLRVSGLGGPTFFQRTPSLVSSRTMPAASSSSRISSAMAKSFAARAFCRARSSLGFRLQHCVTDEHLERACARTFRDWTLSVVSILPEAVSSGLGLIARTVSISAKKEASFAAPLFRDLALTRRGLTLLIRVKTAARASAMLRSSSRPATKPARAASMKPDRPRSSRSLVL